MKKKVIGLLCLVGLVTMLGAGVDDLASIAVPKWIAGTEPVPSLYLYIAFPLQETGIQRAVLVAEEEFELGKVRVGGDAGDSQIDVASVRFETTNNYEMMLHNLITEKQRSFSRYSVQLNVVNKTYCLDIKKDGEFNRYTYHIENERPVADSWYYANDHMKAAAKSLRFGSQYAKWALFGFVALSAAVVIWWRRHIASSKRIT